MRAGAGIRDSTCPCQDSDSARPARIAIARIRLENLAEDRRRSDPRNRNPPCRSCRASTDREPRWPGRGERPRAFPRVVDEAIRDGLVKQLDKLLVGETPEGIDDFSAIHLHATLFDLPVLTTSLTPTPRRASMSMRASVLNRSMRPRKRSLTRGCVTRSSRAASACISRLDVTVF